MRRKLPLFVERTIQEIQAARIELADAFERKTEGNLSISCRPGCSACCYHPIHITVLEAFPIFGALVEQGLWTPSFKERLRKSSEQTSGLSFEVWLLSKLPCPLLEDGRCIAHAHRPFLCRVTIATGDPYYCDSQRLGANTTIVPRQDALKEFHDRERDFLRKHGLLHLTMPIGRAVLMAERVCNGSLMLEDVDRTYVSDHLADEA